MANVKSSEGGRTPVGVDAAVYVMDSLRQMQSWLTIVFKYFQLAY